MIRRKISYLFYIKTKGKTWQDHIKKRSNGGRIKRGLESGVIKD